jgi:tRNA uridine 5-carboxymethylaminomethyl modification enzyme
MQLILNSYSGLEIRAGSAFDLVFDNTEPSSKPWGKISGALLGKYQVIIGGILSTYKISSESGEVISCSQVVICTGTFLSGEIHIGIQIHSFMSYDILIMA